jgi:O-antigen/teichoic acid export membrane protein
LADDARGESGDGRAGSPGGPSIDARGESGESGPPGGPGGEDVRPRRGLFSGSLWAIGGRVASRGIAAAIGFLGSLVWANCFARETYGKYQLITAALAVVGAFCLRGLDDASLISSAKNRDGNLGVILRQRIAVSVAGALVLAGWGVVRYRGADPALMWGFAVAALTFVAIQPQTIWNAFVNGKRRFRLLMVGEVLIALASLVGVGAFALAGWTDGAMLPWVVLASLGLTGAVTLSLLAVLTGLTTNRERDPSIVRYGHHVTAASMLAWVFNSDRLIVGEVLAAPEVALLSVALILPNQVKVFFTAFEQVFLPNVTAAGSIREAWDYIKPRMTGLWASYTALGLLGFFLLPVVIPLVFSERYAASVPLARWLWLSMCLSSPFTFLASILNAQRDKVFLYLKSVASPAITLALFALLIPRYGVVGAVAARVANHALLVVLHVVYFARALRASQRAVPRSAGPA